MSTIRVMLADDQTLFRTMLTDILNNYNDIQVVATASDGEQAIELARKHEIDIALLDLDMPAKGGLEAAREIRQFLPEVRIAILTTFEDVASVTASANAGADAYLIKDIEPDVLVMAIRCILKDLVVIHQSAFSILCPQRDVECDDNGDYSFAGFTFNKTEIMIFRMLTQGLSNREIAKLLHYSEGTVKNRITAILAKTGLQDRASLAMFALRNKII